MVTAANSSGGNVGIVIGGHTVLIDSQDAHLIDAYSWYIQKHRNTFYVNAHTGRGDKRTVTRLHRLILGNPAGIVDHVNRNGLDNRRCNLRIGSIADNCRNSRKSSAGRSSQFKGVCYQTRGLKHWRAKITVSRRDIHLGMFATELEAARAYDTAAIKHHGEFAGLNFPREAEETKGVVQTMTPSLEQGGAELIPEREPQPEQCKDCQGEGAHEIHDPQRDDPYYCRVVSCATCGGFGWVMPRPPQPPRTHR